MNWDNPDFWWPLANPFDPELNGPRIHGNYKGWDIHFDNDLEVDIYKIVTDHDGYQGTECWSWAWYQGGWNPPDPPEFQSQLARETFLMDRVKAYVDYQGY